MKLGNDNVTYFFFGLIGVLDFLISLIGDRSHNFREMLGDFVRRRINKRYD